MRPELTEAQKAKMHLRPLAGKEKEIITAYYHDGKTCAEIGNQYGVNSRSVSRFLKKRGVTMRPTGRVPLTGKEWEKYI